MGYQTKLYNGWNMFGIVIRFTFDGGRERRTNWWSEANNNITFEFRLKSGINFSKFE